MANPYIGFRCPQDIYDALEKYLAETHQEKTEYILELIRKDLGMTKTKTVLEKLESHEEDLKILQQQVNQIAARLNAD